MSAKKRTLQILMQRWMKQLFTLLLYFSACKKKKERKEKNVEFSCGFIGAGTKAPSRLHQGAAVLENLSSGDVSFINAAADEAMSC